MSKRTPIWDTLTDAERQRCTNTIIGFFSKEWDQEIGIIAAEELLDNTMESAFASIYNRGVADAKETLVLLEVDTIELTE